MQALSNKACSWCLWGKWCKSIMLQD